MQDFSDYFKNQTNKQTLYTCMYLPTYKQFLTAQLKQILAISQNTTHDPSLCTGTLTAQYHNAYDAIPIHVLVLLAVFKGKLLFSLPLPPFRQAPQNHANQSVLLLRCYRHRLLDMQGCWLPFIESIES